MATDPASCPLGKEFCSIEGFDLLGADPFLHDGNPAVLLLDALLGYTDVTGCSIVAYPVHGAARYIHTDGTLTGITAAPDRT